MKVYFDFNDWWIGYYRGDNHHYVCPLPTLVISWNRRKKTYPPVLDNIMGMPVQYSDNVIPGYLYFVSAGGKPTLTRIGDSLYDVPSHLLDPSRFAKFNKILVHPSSKDFVEELKRMNPS
jgi:hypothetical protein